MIKKIFLLPLFMAISLHSLTVADAGLAYGKLTASMIAYNLAVVAATTSQEEVNQQLEEVVKSQRATIYATQYSIDSLKKLNTSLSILLEMKIIAIKAQNQANSIRLVGVVTKNLDLTKKDIANAKGN